MAKDKKSFLLYTDLIHTLEKMPNEKAGELFKHILMYVNDMNPETEDLIIQLTFEPIKQQLKRDLQRYETTCEKNKVNGAKGGRPKNPTEPKKSDGLFKEPKKPDTDNDNDSDNDSGIKEKRNTEQPPEGVSFDFRMALLKYGLDDTLVNEWIQVRKKKRAVNSETAYNGFIRELEKASLPKNDVLRICVEKSWIGFDAAWIAQEKTKNFDELGRMQNSIFPHRNGFKP